MGLVEAPHGDTDHRQPPSSELPSIRTVLFRECEFKGRKLLYDSQKAPSTPPHNVIAEMVFGSVAMGFHSGSFKIHELQPNALLLAQIFPSPRHRERFQGGSSNMEQSALFEDSATSSTNSSASDHMSSYSSDHIPGDSLSSLSSGNLCRKWIRSTTNTTNSGSSFGSFKDTSTTTVRSKLGFVLLLVSDQIQKLIQFCMDHISLLESLLNRCRKHVEQAYSKPQSFKLEMDQVWRLSVRGISNLLSVNPSKSNCDSLNDCAFIVPRTNGLVFVHFFEQLFRRTKPDLRTNSVHFVEQFCSLLDAMDCKETSFFMSSLITAVLTHHLGWIKNKIQLPNSPNSSPQWTQLLTLYGSIGNPNKMCQTVVTGQSESTVELVLKCLKYFIRCCDISKYQVARIGVSEDDALSDKIYQESCFMDSLNNNRTVASKCKGLSKTKTLSCMFNEDLNYSLGTLSVQGNELVSNAQDVVFIVGEDINDNLVHSIKTAKSNTMRLIWMPMPRSQIQNQEMCKSPDILSVLKGCSDSYMPDMVLQGTTQPKTNWVYSLKNDLALTSQQAQFSRFVDEVVAVIADLNTWQVHLMSSHTFVIDPNAAGIRVYMSQLVATMLEILHTLWRLKVPVNCCVRHLENSLQELCLRSKTMALVLLKMPFCSLETLTKTLHLDVNDVPLLMAVASVHSPDVTRKYGLSFQ